MHLSNDTSSERLHGEDAQKASFLTADEPKALLNVMRKRKVEALQVRRANALVALDDGHSVQMVSRIFYLDPDTVRGWLRDFREKGLASVELADYPDRLTADQEAALKAQFRDNPPRDTNAVRDAIFRKFAVRYSRPGAIKLMHRLGFAYVKPKTLPKQPSASAQGPALPERLSVRRRLPGARYRCGRGDAVRRHPCHAGPSRRD